MNLKNYLSKALALATIISSATFLGACYPGGPQNISDMDVVLTYPRQNYNFAQLKETNANPNANKYYFKLTEVASSPCTTTIGDIDVVGEIPVMTVSITSPAYLNCAETADVITTIANQMANYGYVLVENAEDANLVIAPFVSVNDYSTAYYNDWYSFWGWGYWYYPSGYYYAYSFTTSALNIPLLYASSLSNTPTNSEALWVAIVAGIDQGTGNINMGLATSGIQQAFGQSLYLDIK